MHAHRGARRLHGRSRMSDLEPPSSNPCANTVSRSTSGTGNVPSAAALPANALSTARTRHVIGIADEGAGYEQVDVAVGIVVGGGRRVEIEQSAFGASMSVVGT
jgi:hypothetical protein